MIPPKDVPQWRDYLNILWRGWWLVVGATALSVGVGWFSWQQTTPVYASSTKILVKSMGDATSLDALYGQINAESRVLTYQYLVRSARVTGPTIDQLGLPQTTGELAGRISITPSLTPILDIVVTGTDPDETRRVADAVTANMIAVSAELAKVDGGRTELLLVDGAGPAKREGSLTADLLQAGFVGFFVSSILWLAWGLFEDRVLGRRQIGRAVENAGRSA
ncbi:hypothetical protein TUM20985_44140 [Mycobacterium antarcticum]|uniref:YveK family protein n=1 Tax=unclassified Mycolicibacterium TaxID=2636767 RepID=UPI0023861FC3|nr:MULTISPECIES: Wzz/FepE/Etk N-terminal domain-containing protein [unclassified Mycolicibacterium]BDX33867.1 hypothetical protein TUM20985_44140 [Mycolicibacterium sp. TUM20985]GLP77041.1 hypothetical protein TUM20983_41510 [Mycolicibacterium sp. TUM20983]